MRQVSLRTSSADGHHPTGHSRPVDSPASKTRTKRFVSTHVNCQLQWLTFRFILSGENIGFTRPPPQTTTNWPTPPPTVRPAFKPDQCIRESIGEEEKEICGLPKRSPSTNANNPRTLDLFRIVNGIEVAEDSWPWGCAVARIENPVAGSSEESIERVCGCTILSRRFVVTAASCLAVSGTVFF